MDKNAQYWIDRLSLSPHPEGGYYRVTYKSDLTIVQDALPSAFHGDRSASTAIYFLLAVKEIFRIPSHRVGRVVAFLCRQRVDRLRDRS